MTTMPALPPAWAPIEEALRARRPVELSYHGRRRLICPHALGWKDGRPMVLGYQTGGQTSTGMLPADPRKRWRCMFVDEVGQVVAAGPPSAWGTADNYNWSHPFHAIDEVTVAVDPDGPSRAG
jgi:hypothetical protein